MASGGGGRRRLRPLGWLVVFLVLAVGTAVWVISRWVGQSATELMAPPRSLPSQTPADFGLTAETVRIPVAGMELVAWFLPPDPAVDGATLIFAHGFAGNRGVMLETAVRLHELGYGALLLDLRNHGESGAALTTWGYAEADDLVAAYNYLLTRPEVNPARIGLLGKSMGGAAAAQAAAQLPGLGVLVLESTYSSFAGNLPNILPGVVHQPAYLAPLVLRRMSAVSHLPLADIQAVDTVRELNVPLLLLHGERDQLVPLAQAQAVFAAANQPKQLVVIPGAGHLNTFAVDPAAYTEHVHRFLTEYLQGDE